jgi:basic membrane lipoprotein Med (substrate-binding protein (PBP1-ABC) superfamily)
MIVALTDTRRRLRMMLLALMAAVSLVVLPAAVDPAQAAAAAAACTYKGQVTTEGGVVKQDDGILYVCNEKGVWVKQPPRDQPTPQAPPES